MMNRCALLLVVLCVVGAGCRQPDGEVPQPTGEHANKTSDIAKDLLNVAGGHPTAREELRDDLGNLTSVPPPPELADALATRLSAALNGSTLDDTTASRLASQLYVATGARDLSERQVEVLKRDVAATMTGAGAMPERAAAVSDTVGEIQNAVGTNRRRWWHVR